MSAPRDFTPRVLDQLARGIAALPRERRVSLSDAQCVVWYLCKWARKGSLPGVWVVTDSVEQIHVGTALQPGQVRKVLDVLARVGVVRTIQRGGGTGIAARGSTRLLVLDPGELRALERAQWESTLRALTPSTARARRSTARAQARDTDMHPVSTSTRWCADDCAHCGGTGFITVGDPDKRMAGPCPGRA